MLQGVLGMRMYVWASQTKLCIVDSHAAQDAGELVSRLKRCMKHQGAQTLGTVFARVMRGLLVIAVVIMKVEVVMVLAVVVVVENRAPFPT